MDEEKILTKHPQGKKGVRISKKKYDQIRSSIIECLRNKELTHLELMKCVNNKLRGNFEGSISWYAETVKLDLEARNIVERNKDLKPQGYRLKL
jgi:hypothetical protein